MRILLVNDDGYNSRGLRALHAALKARGHDVSTVAPEKQHSGAGRSLTVFEPLVHSHIKDGDYEACAVSGTPADCVKLALGGLLPQKPDLVISGINLGPNVGPDINYSGTIGAASEAAHAGLPAMAVSHHSREWPEDLEAVAAHVADMARKINWRSLPEGCVINVNYPACSLKNARGPVICPQSPAIWDNLYEKRENPAGRPYWWLVGQLVDRPGSENCDLDLLLKQYITITPLKFEYTDRAGIDILKNMRLND